MNQKELLKTIISDNQARSLPKIWKRTLEIPLESGKSSPCPEYAEVEKPIICLT